MVKNLLFFQKMKRKNIIYNDVKIDAPVFHFSMNNTFDDVMPKTENEEFEKLNEWRRKMFLKGVKVDNNITLSINSEIKIKSSNFSAKNNIKIYQNCPISNENSPNLLLNHPSKKLTETTCALPKLETDNLNTDLAPKESLFDFPNQLESIIENDKEKWTSNSFYQFFDPSNRSKIFIYFR